MLVCAQDIVVQRHAQLTGHLWMQADAVSRHLRVHLSWEVPDLDLRVQHSGRLRVVLEAPLSQDETWDGKRMSCEAAVEHFGADDAIPLHDVGPSLRNAADAV